MTSSPHRLTLAAFAALAGLACASMGGTPGWVRDPYAGLSRETHLAAVGSGADRQSASANAQGALSQIFSVEIDSVIDDRQELRVVEVGKSAKSSVVQSVDVRTRTRSTGAIEGAEIAEVWKDGDGRRHALAVLDKRKARAALESQIRARSELVSGHLARAASAADPLERAKETLQALEPAVERDALVRRYAVVGGRASREVEGRTTSDLANEAETALADVEIAIDARESDLVSGAATAPLPLLRRDVATALTEMGLHVVADGAGADTDALRLLVRIGLAPVERGVAGWTFYRWEGSYELIQGAGDDALTVSTARGEESHTDPRVARDLAFQKGQLALSRDLKRRLADYLYGDAES